MSARYGVSLGRLVDNDGWWMTLVAVIAGFAALSTAVVDLRPGRRLLGGAAVVAGLLLVALVH